MLTSLTANLHLHPHPPPNSQSKLASVPPGAFPTFTSVSSSGSDFARTISLTPEISTQPIGRSSRNTAKGLVADRNNGFFESAVMSRAHAEVRLVLEPTRKVRASPFYSWPVALARVKGLCFTFYISWLSARNIYLRMLLFSDPLLAVSFLDWLLVFFPFLPSFPFLTYDRQTTLVTYNLFPDHH